MDSRTHSTPNSANPLPPETSDVGKALGKIAAVLADDSGAGRRLAGEMVASAALRSVAHSESEAVAEKTLIRKSVKTLLASARGADYLRGNENPIFRLPANDRTALVLAHAAKWSYAQIGEAIGLAADGAERLLWAARLGLAAERAQVRGAKNWAYPIGASRADASCPDYEVDRPWTQRFLDGVSATRMEHLFLETHLSTCMSCHRSLQLARRIYYDAEAAVVSLDGDGRWQNELHRIWNARVEYLPASARSSRELILRWLKREDTLKLMMLLGLALLAAIVSSR